MLPEHPPLKIPLSHPALQALQPGFDFGPALCSEPGFAHRREWLVTNGIGGYACGTISGVLARRYHGLLVAALQPPTGRTLLVVKADETVQLEGESFDLSADARRETGATIAACPHLVRFRLEAGLPVWTYEMGEAQLEKRVWMEASANTTYVHYRYARGSRPLQLGLEVLVNWRDHHEQTRQAEGKLAVSLQGSRVKVTPTFGQPFYVFCEQAAPTLVKQWAAGYFLEVEQERGLIDVEDHLRAVHFAATLAPGDSITMVASTHGAPDLDGEAAHQRRMAYQQALIAADQKAARPRWYSQLKLAADQFIVRRAIPGHPDGRSIIAGYPWFADWGRDTMISLPGLTLSTGRFELASNILKTFAHFVDQGMLPNNFPEFGQKPGYNTVDATLWYFEAIRDTWQHTQDLSLLAQLYPVLESIIAWHLRGTRYGIRKDPSDGLLFAGEAGVQLTWMDVKIEDWVVTPRTGKPVEINALWYNALRCMQLFSTLLGKPSQAYQRAAEKCREGFQRFWNPELGYLLDVIDGPQGDEARLRPNQIFAVCLPYSPLTPEQQKAVVDVCAQRLYTPHGLRSLAKQGQDGELDTDYVGIYQGGIMSRDSAYHQGTVWGWLLGPFIRAHLRVYRDPAAAVSYLIPMIQQMEGACTGTLSEIFDAEAPHRPRGAFAQAWSVSELLSCFESGE